MLDHQHTSFLGPWNHDVPAPIKKNITRNRYFHSIATLNYKMPPMVTPISDDNSTVSIIFGLVMISQAHSMTWLANFRSNFHSSWLRKEDNSEWCVIFGSLLSTANSNDFTTKPNLYTGNGILKIQTLWLLFTNILSWTWRFPINLAFWSQDCSHQKRPIRWYACFIQLIGDYAIHTNSPHSELYDVSHNWCNGEGML